MQDKLLDDIVKNSHNEVFAYHNLCDVNLNGVCGIDGYKYNRLSLEKMAVRI